MKTQLNKLINRNLINFFKFGPTRLKLKYLIQVNQLYLADDIKEIINSDENQKQTQISVSTQVKWKYFKNEHGDKLLKLHFIRQGSHSIDGKLLELGPQIESLFKADLLESNNFRDYAEYILTIKESENESYFINSEQDINVIDKSKIRLSKYHFWEFEKYPSLLIAGNSGSGKSYQLYEIISEAKKITDLIYICDGKNDELTYYSREVFKLKHISSNERDITTTIKRVSDLMDDRYKIRQDNPRIELKPVFLIIDEFAALKLTMDKKEYNALEQIIKNLILKARASNIHLIVSLQRASAENMNLDIRDNCNIKIGLGNLSVENFKMIFNETISKDKLKHKEIGQGYIYLDGIIKDFKAFNIKFD